MDKCKILIVEDDGIIAARMEEGLKRRGYDVIGTFAAGEEAIEDAERNRPDLVLMDIELAGDLNGVMTADIIRDRFDIPVIFLTAYSDESLVQTAKMTEPYGYLVKPFQDAELVAAIETALYRHRIDGKLRESEERYRSLVELSPEAIIIFANDAVVFANDAAAELLGVESAVEILDRHPAVFVHPEDENFVRSRLGQIQQPGMAMPPIEHRLIRSDGSIVDVETRGVGFRYQDGAARLIMVRDISHRKRYEEELRDQGAFHSVLADLRGVAEEDNEERLLATFVAEVAEQFGMGMVWYGPIEHEEIVPRQWAGRADPKLEHLRISLQEPDAPDAVHPVNRAVRGSTPFGYADLLHAEGFGRWRQDAIDAGYRSALAAPLLIDGNTEGALMFLASMTNAFPEERAERLAMLVMELGVIMSERRRRRRAAEMMQRAEVELKRYSHRIIEVQEEERKRVARELHDGVNQILTAAKMRLHAADWKEPDAGCSRCRDVGKARRLLESAIDEIRNISHNLRPSILDDLGLVPAIRSLCDEVAERSDMDVCIECSGTIADCADEVELTAYRVVQEALSNIVKHAGAKSVKVQLESDHRLLRVAVIDDGCGFREGEKREEQNGRHGLGLTHIRERVGYMGGTMQIESSSHGTKIHVSMPCEPSLVGQGE